MSTATIPVHAKNLHPGLTDLCHSGWSCEVAFILSDLWLLVAIGILTITLLAALSNLRAATERIQEEQSRTSAERDAFKEFAQCIQELSPDTPQAATGTSGNGVLAASAVASQPRQLEKVREAYHETVMAVPHYDEEYGESLLENIAVEFGDDIATSISGSQRLSPMLQQALVAKAMNASAERDRLMGLLADETEEINEATQRLADIDSELSDYVSQRLSRLDFDELVNRYERLDSLEDRCSEVAQVRQKFLHKREIGGRWSGNRFVTYLYDPLEIDHPVLVEVGELLDHIEDARQSLVRAITRRA